MRKIAEECWVQFATQFFGQSRRRSGERLKLNENSNQIKSDEFRNHPADVFQSPIRIFPARNISRAAEIQFDKKICIQTTVHDVVS